MLSAAHRMRRSRDFESAVRRGRRAGSRLLVVHARLTGDGLPPRVGFVVSKAVGSAVVRNRVKRRLRHLTRARVDGWPHGSLVVVRANPAAAEADSPALGRALDRCAAAVLESA